MYGYETISGINWVAPKGAGGKVLKKRVNQGPSREGKN